jgi:hypothetical protein
MFDKELYKKAYDEYCKNNDDVTAKKSKKPTAYAKLRLAIATNKKTPTSLRVPQFWELDVAEKKELRDRMTRFVQQPDNDKVYLKVDNFHEVTWRDMSSLDGNRWLTGFLIDAFLVTFSLFYAQPGHPCLIMMSHFEKDIRENSTGEGMRKNTVDYMTRHWTSEIIDGAIIILPIHSPGHWFLGIIVPNEGVLYILDVYNPRANKRMYFESISAWYTLVRTRWRLPPLKLVLRTCNDLQTRLPPQLDGWSCGVFLCIIAAYFIHTGTLPSTADFDNSDMPDIRLFMHWVIQRVRDNSLDSIRNLAVRAKVIIEIDDDDDAVGENKKNTEQMEIATAIRKSIENMNNHEQGFFHKLLTTENYGSMTGAERTQRLIDLEFEEMSEDEKVRFESELRQACDDISVTQFDGEASSVTANVALMDIAAEEAEDAWKTGKFELGTLNREDDMEVDEEYEYDEDNNDRMDDDA